MFAGLAGLGHRGVEYPDALRTLGITPHTGTLTGYTGAGDTPADAWKWDSTLRRNVLTLVDTGDYVQLPFSPAQSAAGGLLTLSAWWKTIQPVYDSSTIFGPAANDAGGNFIALHLDGAAGGAHAKFTKRVSYTTTSVTGTTVLAANTWYHLMGVLNGSTLTLYVNGIVEGTATKAGALTSTNWTVGTSARTNGAVADPMIFGADMSAFAPMLADPTWSIDYGGLIQPTWRRVFGAATVASAGPTYTLTGTTASVSVTGQSATLSCSRVLTATSASASIDGTAAQLLAARKLTASAGEVAVASQAAGLTASRLLSAAAQAAEITGNAASLLASRKLAAETAATAITGTAAALEYPYNAATYMLSAVSASCAVTGKTVSLLSSRKLVPTTAALAITGRNASLIVSAAGNGLLIIAQQTLMLSA